MTARRWAVVALALLAGCGRAALAPPVHPLTATPEEAWRRSAPALAEPSALTPPETHAATLANGLHVLDAELTQSPYAVALLAVKLAPGTEDAAIRVATAMLHRFDRDPSRLPLQASIGELGLIFSTRAEPDKLDDALAAVRAVLSDPPDAADLLWASRMAQLSAARRRLAVVPEVGVELRRRLVPNAATKRSNGHDPAGQGAFDPADVALIVVCPASHADVYARAERLFGSFRPSEAPHDQSRTGPSRAGPAHGASSIAFLRRDMPLAVIAFGVRAPAASATERTEAALVARMLGGRSISSLLNDSLREAHRITYGVSASYDGGRSDGLLTGVVMVEPARVADALALLRSALVRIRVKSQPVPFLSARERLRATWARATGHADALSLHLAADFLAGLEPSLDREAIARLDQLSPESIREFARSGLGEPVFVIAGGPDAADALGAARVAFEPVVTPVEAPGR